MQFAMILRAAPMLALVAMSGPVRAQAPAPNEPAAAASNAFIAQRRPDQWLASSLRSKNVYDRNDAKIGVINDLVVGHDGRVAAVVIGVGGFLGIGEKNVGVPFADIKISMRENNEWLVLDRSRDDLRAAPAFGTVSSPGQDVGGGNDRNYGTLNAPHHNEEAAPR
jgi:sporulation protein YlmC with PRC-barrel domain